MKSFQCEKCSWISNAEDWNERTEFHFGIEKGKVAIENKDRLRYLYACPSCFKINEGTHVIPVKE